MNAGGVDKACKSNEEKLEIRGQKLDKKVAIINYYMIYHFKDLDVYQRAQKLYPKVIEFSRAFPKEGFHLRDQVCRSANSIQSNIAEGFGRSVAE